MDSTKQISLDDCTLVRAGNLFLKPGVRRFSATTGDYQWLVRTGRDVTLDDVIMEQVKEGPDEDRAIWEGEKLLAVLKHNPKGETDVIRLETRQDWKTPELKRRGLFREFTLVHACHFTEGNIEHYAGHGMTAGDVIKSERDAVLDSVEGDNLNDVEKRENFEAIPDSIVIEKGRVVAVFRFTGPDAQVEIVGGDLAKEKSSASAPCSASDATEQEQSLLHAIRTLGHREASDRLWLKGPYLAMADLPRLAVREGGAR